MKNRLLALTAIISLTCFGLAGCGGTEQTVVAPADQPEPGLSAEQQATYEAEMQAEGGN